MIKTIYLSQSSIIVFLNEPPFRALYSYKDFLDRLKKKEFKSFRL